MRRAGLIAALAAVAALAIPAAASAANPTILNTNTGCSGQTSWLISCATAGQTGTGGNANQLRISGWFSHDTGNTLASLLTDDDWDGTNDVSTVRGAGATRPNIFGGYPRSRSNVTYQLPTGNTGMSCDGFPGFGGTRRTDNRVARIAARDSGNQTSGTSSSQIKFLAAGSCTGPEDFAYIYTWGTNNFVNSTSLEPGEQKTFTYTGDDSDTTGNSDFDGIRWRTRNIRTGALSAETDSCPSNGDNASKSLTVTFPDRGAFVVEAELLTGNTCNQDQNPNYWVPIGTADVNSAGAPSLSLDSATTTQSGVVRPQFGQDWTVRAQGLVDPDAGDGGGAQIVEWDVNNNTGDGASGFEASDIAGYGSTLPANTTTQNVDSSPQAAGLYSVRAKVTDNGAGDAADPIRRTGGAVTLQYRVDAAPTANGQTVTTDTGATNAPMTLTGSDPDGDSLSWTTGAAANGTVGGSGAARTYTPAAGFAGTDSFSVTANDGFGRTDDDTVSLNVRPGTTITDEPPAFTNDASPDVAFNSNATAVATNFQCKLDGGSFTSCNSPQTFPGLADGAHTVQVKAAAGGVEDASPDTTSFTVDTVAPSAGVDAGPPDPSNDTTPEIDFSNTETPVTSPVSFQCQLDGDGFDPCSSPYVTPVLADDVHTFEVKATDAAGNASGVDSITWRSDATDPQTAIESTPANPTSNPDAEFDFASNELGGYECRLDSTAPGDFDPCAEHSEFEDLAPGEHTLDVRALDLAGNADETPASFEWTIDGLSGETSIDSTPSNPSSNVNPDFEFSSNELGTFECRLDSADEVDFLPCASPHGYSGLGEGEHTFEVRSIDIGGNVDATPASHTWLIDLTVPETGIDSTPPNPSPSPNADFEFSSNELATFECRLDSVDEGDFAACASPASYGGLLDGTHTFEVRALDLAGNFDPTPASATWTIDSGLEFPESLSAQAAPRGSGGSGPKKCKGKRKGKCKRKRGGK